MTKLVTIYGGAGFVGRYIARRMANAGWRVRVTSRRPNEATFVRPYGVVGQVEPVFCNIRDDESVRAAMLGADAVINCVGILAPHGANSFAAVHDQGAARIARIAAQSGVARLVHLSAIGADAQSPSTYASTKAAGEAAVIAAFPGAVILRPSVIFGQEDGFFNRLAAMPGPIMPIVGGKSLFQPVYVDDVARAAEMGAIGTAAPGVYELGGPDVRSLRAITRDVRHETQRRKLVIDLPFWLANLAASIMGLGQRLTFGLWRAGLTRDQIHSLRRDNVVSPDARGFADLGIVPTPYNVVIPDYLWPHRRSGQYAAINESASRLRHQE